MEVGTLIGLSAAQTAYAVAGGAAIIAKTGKTQVITPGVIGLYAETKTVDSKAYARVRLLVPIIDKDSKSYAYVWVIESACKAVADSEFSNYYAKAKSGVNARLRPDTAGSSLLGNLPNGTLIGRGTNLTINGFYYVRLAKPINGTSWAWVSKLYVTKTAPTPSADGSAVSSDGESQPIIEVIDTTLANTFGDDGATTVKWGGRIMLVLGVAVLVWFGIKRVRKHKPNGK